MNSTRDLAGEPTPRAGPGEIEEVLAALSGSSGSGTLYLLGMTTADLNAAKTDRALFETLKIVHELLLEVRDEGVLGTFLLLPKDRQMNFVRWIGATDAKEVRRIRTATFIGALKASPLADSAHYGGSG